jgi:hypothetical protein
MTKKELKDIILKTLEKEGGAAGLKALAKAAKTPKNKLKKDLDDMSGVKQHQDGDYISTPINERETAQAGMFSSGGSCICSCPEGYGTPTLGSPTFQYGGGGYSASDCEAACNSVPCYELEGGTTTTSTPGSGKDDIFVEPVKRPSKPIRKPTFRKPTFRKPTFRKPERSKKPMRLREAEEAIIEMINEKLCKKGKAYIAKRKRAGEKSSAYLSGRAVKVCKGQMKG